MQSKQILDAIVDNVTFTEAIEQIEYFVKTRKPHQIVTINPEFIMEAQKNILFRDVINRADLRVPDGIGLVWLGGFPERVSGADLIIALAKKRYKIFLLGGEVGVAQKAGEALVRLGARIVGAEDGGVVTDIKQFPGAVLDQIKKTRPDILLVGFGAPKQDLFIAKYKNDLKVPVSIGVGGTFDYLAGIKPRAPKFFRRLGVEWLWRLIIEPRRLNRIMMATIRFPIAYLASRIKVRIRGQK